MIKYKRKDFDIFQISNSGQCFRMEKVNEHCVELIADDKYLDINQDEEYIAFSCTEPEYENIWKHYFDLETDYSYIKGRIDPEDSYMIHASECGGGIRILRQELFETIISFIISQQNNIPRIKKCIRVLAERYGEVKYNYKNQQYYAFPKPGRLAYIKETELKSLGFGYRSRYIVETANAVVDGSIDLEKLKIMSYNDSKKELMQLSGVGNKVSDCICLFALHHIDAFPIDTHIKDVLVRYYKNGFPLERYNGFAGVLQQYAFYYEVYGAKYMRLNRGISDEL